MDGGSRADRLRRLERLSRRPLTALAIRTARQYLGDYPDDGSIWVILGRALCDADRYEEAEQALSKGIQFSLPEAWLHWGRAKGLRW